MCDSVWPHRRQPISLPHPWDSPGKNSGVGCHFLLQCMKVKSESEVLSRVWLSDPMDCSPPGSSVHGIFQASVLEWVAIAFSRLFTNVILVLLFEFWVSQLRLPPCFSTHMQTRPIHLQDVNLPSFLEITLTTQSALISCFSASVPCSCYSLRLLLGGWISLSVSFPCSTTSMLCLLFFKDFLYSGGEGSGITSFSFFLFSHHLCHILIPKELLYHWTHGDA